MTPGERLARWILFVASATLLRLLAEWIEPTAYLTSTTWTAYGMLLILLLRIMN